jgi:formate-dependent nitrite reductase cytochrome c552 subunit
VAYGPEDFPEIDFEMKLQPHVQEAVAGDEVGVFTVPPPPFSEDYIFPCTECHADLEVNTERRELVDMHDDIVLDHGPAERWCLDCHNANDRDHLRLVNGTLVGFEESYKLCGQCHGTIFRDWREGIHGRRRGYWDGAKEYLLCAHCHNPHAPKFQAMKPMPPPVRPQFLRGPAHDTEEGTAEAEEVHEE